MKSLNRNEVIRAMKVLLPQPTPNLELAGGEALLSISVTRYLAYLGHFKMSGEKKKKGHMHT